MDKEPTNYEILEAINTFANHTEKRFQKIEESLGGMKSEIGGMKSEIGSIRAQMVTKDYLDEKINSMRGDLVSVIKQEDDKFKTLICVMRKRELISFEDEKVILSMKPFPKLYV